MPITAQPLQGRVAMVTGSSRGIGRAIALELARWGADVVVHAMKNVELAESVATGIRQLGRRAIVVLGDVRDKAAMDACAERAKAELGAVDILVNNAGTRKDGAFILMGDDKWQEVMDVNLKGTVLATKACVRASNDCLGGWMRLKSPGSVVSMRRR